MAMVLGVILANILILAYFLSIVLLFILIFKCIKYDRKLITDSFYRSFYRDHKKLVVGNFLFLPVFVAGNILMVNSRAEKKEEKKWEDAQNELLKNSEITQLENKVFFSKKGNPVGVVISYKIKFNTATSISDGILPRPKIKELKPYQPTMWMFKNETHPSPELSSKHNKISKYGLSRVYKANTVYSYVEYWIPSFLSYDYKKRGDSILFHQSPLEMDFASGMCIKGKKSKEPEMAAFYFSKSPEVLRLPQKYSVESFYEGAIKEGLKECM